MTVYFIGAGPGAADLITVRGRRLIEQSAVCLYAGSLIPEELLEACPAWATVINSAPLDLEGIVKAMVDAHRAGHDVARLHSGDVSVYSACAEQMRRLDAEGVPYEMVPGVPAFSAAAAALGRELTVPTVGQSIILTRIGRRATAMPEGETLENFGRTQALLVLHLSIADIDDVVARLTPYYGAECPTAVVAYASHPGEAVLRGTLSTIAEDVRVSRVTRTALILVGQVLAAQQFPDSHLYSADRDRPDHLCATAAPTAAPQ